MENKEINFIKFMARLLFMTLCISVAWNIICLLGFLPLRMYHLTYVFVLIPSILTCIRTLYFRDKDTAKHIFKINSKERVYAVLSVLLFIAWITTLLACVVY